MKRKAEGSEPAGGQGTVLVAEGQHDTRLMMKWALEQHGYRVLLAETGEQVVEAAEREPPDLILLDLHLPGLDALEAVRRLRRREGLGRVPIVGTSALDSAEAQAAALAAGCTVYRRQPVDFDKFGEVADLMLHRREGPGKRERGRGRPVKKGGAAT